MVETLCVLMRDTTGFERFLLIFTLHTSAPNIAEPRQRRRLESPPERIVMTFFLGMRKNYGYTYHFPIVLPNITLQNYSEN